MTFKDLIFFNHVQFFKELEVLETKDKKSHRYDFFMVDQYGYPVIVDLKKSDVNVIVSDSSHDKNAFSSDTSKAVSQLMGYMNKFIEKYD